MIFAAMYMGDFSAYKEKAFIDSHAEIPFPDGPSGKKI